MKSYWLLTLLFTVVVISQAHMYGYGYAGGYAGGYPIGYPGYPGTGPVLGPSVLYGTPLPVGAGVLPYGYTPFAGGLPMQAPVRPFELMPIGAVAMMGYSVSPYPYGFTPDYF